MRAFKTYRVLAIEPNGFDNGVCDVFDAHFFVFTNYNSQIRSGNVKRNY